MDWRTLVILALVAAMIVKTVLSIATGTVVMSNPRLLEVSRDEEPVKFWFYVSLHILAIVAALVLGWR